MLCIVNIATQNFKIDLLDFQLVEAIVIYVRVRNGHIGP